MPFDFNSHFISMLWKIKDARPVQYTEGHSYSICQHLIKAAVSFLQLQASNAGKEATFEKGY